MIGDSGSKIDGDPGSKQDGGGGPSSDNGVGIAKNDIVELEGFSSKEENGKASKEIVTKLIEELESMTEKESLTGSKPLILDVAAEKSTDKEEWAYVGTSKGGQASPIKKAESCRSPNGFQVLQDLREEGEIDGEDEDIVEENMENDVLKGYIAKAVEVEEDGGADKDGFVVKDPPSVDPSVDLTGDTRESIQRQSSYSRGRGTPYGALLRGMAEFSRVPLILSVQQ
ncbi:hypothetical protein F2Q69_00021660 [Brassica cretica]|uniref:Uncharacterized protein n=1 Tax=Brassica cretica TaxID=69181 RepID=A0A8S9QIK9_BRACR|nr:hypothetical protein F2Q69_00021660 [Brassica cretica]